MSSDRLATIGRQLVSEFLLDEGERVLEVRAGPDAALVTASDGGWRVFRPAELGVEIEARGYELFCARTAVTDASDVARGFAVLPDGRALRLSDPTQLRALVDAAEPRPGALEMACLVALFAGPQPEPRFLVTRRTGAEDGEATDGDLAHAPGPPQVTTSEPGHAAVTLFTYSWRYPDEETEVQTFERWDVRLDPNGLDWDRHELP